MFKTLGQGRSLYRNKKQDYQNLKCPRTQMPENEKDKRKYSQIA